MSASASLPSPSPHSSSAPQAGSLNSSNQTVALEQGKPLPEDRAFTLLYQEVEKLGWNEEQLHKLEQCYAFARKAHEGQLRKNGENYIVHPVEVALILAQKVHACPDTILAALLHDVLEDTDADAKAIEREFGSKVLQLVQGVTKLGRYQFSSKQEQHAENFRRMFLAMAEDPRVITLKLADRLHNMRTLYFMKPEKQKKIASETIDIFAPLANRMGMGNFRAELEDLSLQYLQPEAYQLIEDELVNTKVEREETINDVCDRIRYQLEKSGIQCRIYGRVKNYFSIYKKMQSNQKGLSQIFDISALRVIVDTEPACYEVLGVIHNSFTPVAGRFKDYIAMPKSNFYQSLHTTIIGPKGRPVEVQIRTHRMHEVAEYGVAAHFKYKETGGSTTPLNQNDQKMAWLKQITEMQQATDTAQEFVENVRLDLFPDEVFVFTPKGEVISLPRGSTPIDFAFRIHTEVGHKCSGAIVNERIVPLDSELNNGDMVEIITNKKATPRLDWVNFVQTQHAKTRIRQWYKRHFRDQHEQQGRQLLEAELTRKEVDQLCKTGELLQVAHALNYKQLDDLYVAIGYGEMPVARVLSRVKRLKQEEEARRIAILNPDQHDAIEDAQANEVFKPKRKPEDDNVVGLKGLLYNIAKCCMPVPGDSICGVVTRSRGVMVHRDDCINAHQANPARIMQLSWDGPVEMNREKHGVCLEVTTLDRIGIFKDVLTAVSDLMINLLNAKSKPTDENKQVTIELAVEVKDLDQLDKLLKGIKAVPDVMGVKRRPHRPNHR